MLKFENRMLKDERMRDDKQQTIFDLKGGADRLG